MPVAATPREPADDPPLNTRQSPAEQTRPVTAGARPRRPGAPGRWGVVLLAGALGLLAGLPAQAQTSADKPVADRPAGAKAPSSRKSPARPTAGAKAVKRAAAPAAVAAGAGGAALAAASGPSPVEMPALQAFIAEMVERHRFEEPALKALFSGVRLQPEVLRLIAPPPPGFRRSWSAYRARFIEPVRLREGARFWSEHEATLARATQRWGVPAEIIVAIIGVETIYGRVMGEYRVIDALTTLALQDPRRSAYFREELSEYLLHTRDAGIDPLSVRGSYAGAIGIPQFMPASIRRFAVDFDGNATIDLRASPVDAIGSVARFLAEHGWRGGEPTHFRVKVDDPARAQALIAGGIEPRIKPAQLPDHGLSSPDRIPEDMPLALVDLPEGEAAPVYWLGAPNFYVITRYNRSNFYAMAVIELAETLRSARAR
ncbi:MAG: lytic murein transglycosylase B [Betaproteobacteria bacterium]|nr:lytic murein transglycosylase B [Betaproteobacteria bacterium]